MTNERDLDLLGHSPLMLCESLLKDVTRVVSISGRWVGMPS